MTPLVVDASVVVKWFVAEEDSDAALRLFDGDELFVAPAHMLAEVGEVLVRRLRKGEVTRRQLEIARDTLPDSIVYVPLGEPIGDAVDIAQRHAISVDDALYLATARRRDAVFVTADTQLARRVGATVQSRVVDLASWAKAR